jgi:hypothetical protein
MDRLRPGKRAMIDPESTFQTAAQVRTAGTVLVSQQVEGTLSSAAVRQSSRRTSALSLKALLIGGVLMVGNCYLLFEAEPVRGAQLSNAAPFANVIFLLALLTAANALLTRCLPRFALRSMEMMVIYVLLSVQSALSSGRFIFWLLVAITYGFWFDTPQKGWKAHYGPELPSWLTVQNKEAIKGFYLGNSSFFTSAHLSVWLAPLLLWSLFFFVLGAVLCAIAMLFTRQWIHHERLTFPVVELPYQMTAPDTNFWRQRLMWAGFALAASLELLDGLNYWFPSLPYIPIRRTNLALLFTTPPWDAIKELNLSFYPFIIGLGFLMPLDLSFSAIFFLLLARGQEVMGRVTGIDSTPNFPFMREQQFGAIMAILVALLWGSRRHLREVARAAFGRASEIADPAEARLYRNCLLTVGLGTLGLIGFLMAAGMGWWVAAVFVVVYCAIGLVVARVRAELGFPSHPLFALNGSSALMMTVGGDALGLRNVTQLCVFGCFTLYNSNHILPYQMEGMRLADRAGIGAGRMIRVIMLAVGVGIVATFLINLAMLYSLGAAAKAHFTLDLGQYTWEQILPSWTQSGPGALYRRPQWASMGVIATSFSFCCLLMTLRARCLWFPLHPVGLALGNTLNDVWTAIVVAMLVKWLLLRYSGLKGYRTALPFFLGLILGDMVVGMGWIAIGILFNTPTYIFYL